MVLMAGIGFWIAAAVVNIALDPRVVRTAAVAIIQIDREEQRGPLTIRVATRMPIRLSCQDAGFSDGAPYVIVDLTEAREEKRRWFCKATEQE